MLTYYLEGVVLPERAQLTLRLPRTEGRHASTRRSVSIEISIILNQVAAWIETEEASDIDDLRNVAKYVIGQQLSIIGYLKGFAYDLEIKRITNKQLGIDNVFGIDVPCIGQRNKSIDVEKLFRSIQMKCSGHNGTLIVRCFNDLIMALKNPEETGFYCYRGIESLRHHCAASFEIQQARKAEQWSKFREITKVERREIDYIKNTADPVRHGEHVFLTSADREVIFLKTWDIVDAYIAQLE